MTYLEFLQRKLVSSIFEWLPNEETGTQNDRMVSHLKRHTRLPNNDINDLYHKPSIWTRELIIHLVEDRIRRY